MRSVSSVESLLKRLDALAGGVPLAATAEAQQPVSANPEPSPAAREKKTLKIEPAALVDDSLPEPPDDEIGFAEPAEVFEQAAPVEPSPAMPHRPVSEPRKAVEVPTTRLPRLTSDELEHIEDPKLDDAYELALLLSGDDLMPIRSAQKLAEALLAGSREETYTPRPAYGGTAGNGAAAKPAFDVDKVRAEIGLVIEDVELPELSPDPSDAELQAYVRAHPAVRAAMRVFRAKVVEVNKLGR
jgi:hypothetical protein